MTDKNNSVKSINSIHGFVDSEIIFDVEEETIIDDKKYITIYTKDELGIITKHTKIYRIETRKIKMNKDVAERRTWEKFGVSKGLPPGPDKASTNIVYDEVFFEFTNNNKIADDKEEDSGGIFGSSNKSAVTCRHCGGNHWSIKCTNKGGDGPSDNGPSTGTVELESRGKYVPKFKRDGVDTSKENRNRNTINITNISTNSTDQDVRDLFHNYGRISRLYYNEFKGFAYLTYSSLDACEKAIEAVNGHPYDHLILSVKMAETKT
jgi:translation initiation factor 3 subunit G